jgi:hypothetical protein
MVEGTIQHCAYIAVLRWGYLHLQCLALIQSIFTHHTSSLVRRWRLAYTVSGHGSYHVIMVPPCRRRVEEMRQREAGWNRGLQYAVWHARKPEYNALYDVNMRHFFENEKLQTHLYRMGLVRPSLSLSLSPSLSPSLSLSLLSLARCTPLSLPVCA